jgi:co-chaperonin GroES (HSP10)
MSMLNSSGIKAVGWTVLVKPAEIEKKSESGIILHAPTEEDRAQLAQCFGQVVEIGPIAWVDEGQARCKVGDRVIFRRYAGEQFDGDDGVKYRLMNDKDVLAIKE